MTSAQRYRLVGQAVRERAKSAVMQAPEGYEVRITPPRRSLDQNAMLHAICADIARSGHHHAGEPRSPAEWKCLLVSAHTYITGHGLKILPGIEGEYVNVRESTASMSKARGSSLIDYALAYCALNSIKLSAAQWYP